MASIDVSDETAVKLRLLAKAWRVTSGVAVQRLIEEFEADLQPISGEPSRPAGQIKVHAIYQGTRTSALYDRLDRSLLIESGACAGRRFNTPSAAAIAVVSELNPGVNPSRNGWGFWVVDDTGQRLSSVRY